jgi:hypothetical protein
VGAISLIAAVGGGFSMGKDKVVPQPTREKLQAQRYSAENSAAAFAAHSALL